MNFLSKSMIYATLETLTFESSLALEGTDRAVPRYIAVNPVLWTKLSRKDTP